MELRIPELGLEEGETAEVLIWRVEKGAAVKEDEELVDLGVDKVVYTVTAPRAGRIGEIRLAEKAAGEQGDVLCVID